jgi:hypothetical protein
MLNGDQRYTTYINAIYYCWEYLAVPTTAHKYNGQHTMFRQAFRLWTNLALDKRVLIATCARIYDVHALY